MAGVCGLLEFLFERGDYLLLLLLELLEGGLLVQPVGLDFCVDLLQRFLDIARVGLSLEQSKTLFAFDFAVDLPFQDFESILHRNDSVFEGTHRIVLTYMIDKCSLLVEEGVLDRGVFFLFVIHGFGNDKN